MTESITGWILDHNLCAFLELPSHEERAAPEGPLALLGALDGPDDLAERHNDDVRERMRERFGDQAGT